MIDKRTKKEQVHMSKRNNSVAREVIKTVVYDTDVATNHVSHAF
jgi:hypothetical protein